MVLYMFDGFQFIAIIFLGEALIVPLSTQHCLLGRFDTTLVVLDNFLAIWYDELI